MGLKMIFYLTNMTNAVNLSQPSACIGGGLHAPVHVFLSSKFLGNDNTSPPLATASAVAQAHWRRRPQNKSRAAPPCLRQPACNGARAEQPLWRCRGQLSAQFSPAAAAAPIPLLVTASAVAQAHWRRRPQNKSRAASPC